MTRPARPSDLAILACLALASAAFVASLPHALGGSDEGLYLYEAKRLLEGQVFYRDVFDLITPGAHYLMAAAFWLLGADLATARAVDAAVQGLIVAAAYAACRLLGVRRWLALAAAAQQLVVFQPAWTVASPHWLASLLALLLLVVLLCPPGRRPGGPGALPGVLVGLLVVVQQQKGAVLGAAAALVLIVEWLAGDRSSGLVRRLASFAVGAAAIVVPVGVGLVAGAGLAPVVQALIEHPLVNYRGHHHVQWGALGTFPSAARYTFPRVLALLPLVAAAPALRAAMSIRRAGDPERLRRSLVLLLVALASIASIAYYPDFIHLAFIGAVFAVIAADAIEGVLGALLRGRAAAFAVGLGAAAFLLASATHLVRFWRGSWQDWSFPYASPFGRIDMPGPREVELLDGIRRALAAAGAEELFVYPAGAAFYLGTGTINPTPFQILLPGYSRPDQLEQAIAILEARRTPFVLVLPFIRPDDPVADYVRRHYDKVEGPALLMRRRDAAAEAR